MTSVATLGPDRTAYVSALWEVDPAGERPARRLTRSAKGETPVAFLSDGGLLFTSSRPDPQAKADEDPPAALWLLPGGGGEAPRRRRPGRRGAGGCRGPGRRDRRADVGDTAGLHGRRRRRAPPQGPQGGQGRGDPARQLPGAVLGPRLGPDEPRLLAGRVPAEPTAGTDDPSGLGGSRCTTSPPLPGRSLDEAQLDVSPRRLHGRHDVEHGGAGRPPRHAGVDRHPYRRATGAPRRRGRGVRGARLLPRRPPAGRRGRAPVDARRPRARVHLAVLDLATAERTDLAPGWDRWPHGARWTPDGSALVFPADDQGRSPRLPPRPRRGRATGAADR